MYLIFKRGKLREIFSLAIKKAGSIRKLGFKINIPRSTILNYYQEKTIIKDENLQKVLDYLGIKLDEKEVMQKLENNWKQIKGGKKCVESKKLNGTYEAQLKRCQKKGGSNYLKTWHADMKKKNLDEYHILQYKRFKKIGNYKFRTNNGEDVRNKLEKEIADLLKDLKLNYKYEPLIKIEGRYFFPDFLIDNKIIIECTEWRGFDKALKLKDKLKFLEKNYKVYVVIPKALNRYYEILNHCLVLGTENLIPKLKFP